MAYNRKTYYENAIESVKAQTLDSKLYEIILVANFYPDIESLTMRKVVVIYSDDAPGASLSKAIDVSKGEVIALLDDDDQWEKNKLEIVFNFFSKDADLIYYHNNVTFIDNSGKNMKSSIHSISINKLSKSGITFISTNRLNYRSIRQMLGHSMDFNNSSICFRRSVYNRKRRFISTVKASLDTSLFIASLTCGNKLCNDSRELTKYRMHIQNSSFSVKNDKGELSLKKEKFNERRLNQFKEAIKDNDIVANPAVRRSVEYLISSVKLDLYWLRSRREKLNLMREILNYSRYICFSQITYDAGIMLISLLFILFPDFLRNKYLSIE